MNIEDQLIMIARVSGSDGGIKTQSVQVGIDCAEFYRGGTIELKCHTTSTAHKVHGIIIAKDIDRVAVMDMEHDRQNSLRVHGWFDRKENILFVIPEVKAGDLLWSFDYLTNRCLA